MSSRVEVGGCFFADFAVSVSSHLLGEKLLTHHAQVACRGENRFFVVRGKLHSVNESVNVACTQAFNHEPAMTGHAESILVAPLRPFKYV